MPVPQPVVYIHIPKTAGSTVRTAFLAAYKPKEIGNSGNILRDASRPAARIRAFANRGVRAIVGHAPYSAYVANGFADARFVTLLREPVDHVLSFYHFLVVPGRRSPQILPTRDGPELLPAPTAEMTAEQMLEQGVYLLDNLSTRMLSDAPTPYGTVGREELEQAKRNLSRFAFVGLTERFDESFVLLQRALDLGSAGYESKKVNTDRPPLAALPAEQRRALADLNALDIELYAHARELFEARLAAVEPQELADDVAALRRRSVGAERVEAQLVSPLRQPRTESDAPLVFLHIPKTGGSTLGAVLRGSMRQPHANAGSVFRSIERMTQRLPRLHEAHLITGEVPYSLLAASLPDEARFTTVLRDPVERTLSHYYWLLTETRDGEQVYATREGLRSLTVPTADIPLVEMLDRGEYVLDNLATRMLSDAASPFGPVGEAQLEQAKRNLSRFALVGLTERLEETIALLQQTFGLTPVAYANQKVNAGRPHAEDLSAAEREAIAGHNRLDLELYAHARELFESRVATRRRTKQPRPAAAPLEDRLRLLAQAEAMTPLIGADLGDHGRYMLSTRDRHVTVSLFVKPARGEMRTLKRTVDILRTLRLAHDTPGTLLDVGANIGTTTVTALRSGAFARGVACEPEPGNAALLRLNVVANDLEDAVTVCPVAVGDANASVPFVVVDRRSGMHEVHRGAPPATPQAQTTIHVPQVTLDALARSGVFDPDDVSLLWMDVQGSEGHVLRGAAELTARGVPIVAELDPRALARHDGLELLLEIAKASYTHFVSLRHARGRDTQRFDLDPIENLVSEVEWLTETQRFTDVLLVRDPPGRPVGGGVPRDGRRAAAAPPAAPVPAPIEPPSTTTARERKTFLRNVHPGFWSVVADVDGASFVVRTSADAPEASIFVEGSHRQHRLLAEVVGTLEQLGLADDARARGFLDLRAGVGLAAIAAVRWHGFANAVAVEPDPETFRALKLAVAVGALEEQVRAVTVLPDGVEPGLVWAVDGGAPAVDGGAPAVAGTPPLVVRLAAGGAAPDGYTHFVRVRKGRSGAPQPIASLARQRDAFVLLLRLQP